MNYFRLLGVLLEEIVNQPMFFWCFLLTNVVISVLTLNRYIRTALLYVSNMLLSFVLTILALTVNPNTIYVFITEKYSELQSQGK
jgi:hypothetical protein